MSKIFRQLLRVLLIMAALLPFVAVATVSAAANHKPNLFVATGWPKGNWHFNIVVGYTADTTLYMYTDDSNSYKAKVNNQGWATFQNVDFTGALNQDADDGKLSFTKVVNGKQKPINYTQRYYASSSKISFSALYYHPTTDISDIQNNCDDTSNSPAIILTVTNHSSHDTAYDITIGTFNAAGKQVGSEEGILSTVAGQELGYQSLFGTSKGSCGVTARVAWVNAYDSTNDNGQPNF